MLRRWNIGNKLTLILIGFSVFISALLSALFYFQFEGALRERVLLQLSSIKQLKMVKIRTEIEDRILAFNQPDSVYLASDRFIYTDFHQAIPEKVLNFSIPRTEVRTTSTILIDLTNQDTSKEIVIAFVSKQADGYKIGIAEIPEIQSILLERTGLGETGESYIVSHDYRLLTKSRTEALDPRNIKVKSQGVIRAFNGQPGEDSFVDYRNIPVFGAYEQIQLNGLNWVLLSEINVDEALSPLHSLRIKLILIFAIILFVILVLSYTLSKMLVSPIVLVERKLIRMSQGILEKPAPVLDRKDEIGRMFEALNNLIMTLENTIHFADRIGSGDFEATYKVLGSQDKIGEALLRMKSQLKEFKENEKRLIQENQQSILSGEEKERSRLSKEMHDGLGPLLTTLRINIQLASLPSKTSEQLLSQLDDTIREVRRMSNNLMPSVLMDFGAGEAIGNLVQQLQDTMPVCFKFKNDMPPESEIDDTIQIALYRIAQESINNALKHSNATEIRISLSAFDDHVGYFISDNGCGFEPELVTHGNGMRNMKERIKLVNGTIQIESNEAGTTIEIEIPII